MEVLEKFLKELKEQCAQKELGMILVHVGIVRGTSKEGNLVQEMYVDFSEERLQGLIKESEKKEGICGIKVWINKGVLKVGDPIMVVAVAGRFRKDVLPCLEELLNRIKKEVVKEEER